MHQAARDFISRSISNLSVLEIGSLDVNGGIRDLFPGWDYLGIDRVAGPGVDVVADGATFDTPKRFDAIVCCEVLEHAANWREIVANAARLLRPSGWFWGTAAGPGRAAHTCSGHPMPEPPTEHYANVDPHELERELEKHFLDLSVEHRGTDVRWSARNC